MQLISICPDTLYLMVIMDYLAVCLAHKGSYLLYQSENASHTV